MPMDFIVPDTDLFVAAIAGATIVFIHSVAALAPSVALKRAWWVLGGMLGCCILLLFVHAALTFGRAPSLSDLVAVTIFLVGVLFIYATVWLSRRTAREMLRMESMAQDAYCDALTGIGNRRRFTEALELAAREADRHRAPLALVVLDVDHFKSVNDTYGHAAGDTVLCSIAETLAAGIRPADTVCRVGGEEFAILMPELESPFAIVLAERLRASVTALQIPLGTRGSLSVTISLGFARRDHGETGPALLQRADAALYAAKHSGRDCLKLAV